MSNDFFGNHPLLGSVFDFDRDGSLDLGEAAFMGAMGAAFIDEAERSARDAERESHVWDDDDDYDEFGNRKRNKRRSDDLWDDDYDSEGDDW